jgi:hypothetical protein
MLSLSGTIGVAINLYNIRPVFKTSEDQKRLLAQNLCTGRIRLTFWKRYSIKMNSTDELFKFRVTEELHYSLNGLRMFGNWSCAVAVLKR